MTSENTLSARVKATFGFEQFPDALFYHAEYALRFELGGDLSMQRQLAPRFLQAMDRSRQVAAVLFGKTERLSVVIRYHGDGTWRTGRRRTLVGLARAGFRLPFGPAQVLRSTDDEPEWPIFNYWHQVEIANDPNLVAAVLWCLVASETPVRPRAGFGMFNAYLVDFEAGTALHVYDDRGMDVVATTRKALRPLYTRFEGWLLDWDRQRMDATFAS